MARPELPASLSEIRNPTSVQEQIAALKQLKNEIIGHPLIKELVVNNGIAAPLVRNLQTSLKVSGKRKKGEHDGRKLLFGEDFPWTHEDELRLQTITIITSLAHGGPNIVGPLLAQGILPHLLSALSPSTLPGRLVVETLRALNVIAEADAIRLYSEDTGSDDSLESALFSRSTIDALADILRQPLYSAIHKEQYALALKLLACTIRTKKTRHALVKAGVLDILATRLAAYANDELKNSGGSYLSLEKLPGAGPRSCLPPLLDAITQIIRGSSYRCMRLICNKDMLALFPPPPDLGNYANSVGYLLPKLEALQGRSARDYIQKAFPALAAFDKASSTPRARSDAPGIIIPDEVVLPLRSWLVELARTTIGAERLSTIWLLAHLIPALSKVCPDSAMDPPGIRGQERHMELLIVPILVKIIEEATANPTAPSKPLSIADQQFLALVRERAPKALAKLIADSSALQKAALDAGAVKVLSQLLKRTFDPVSPSRQAMWSPINISPMSPRTANGGLGVRTFAMTPEIMHLFRARSAALCAIAVLGQKEDNPRKYILEASVMQSIYDSLRPLDPDMDASAQPNSNIALEANSTDVLVAACKAVTALSRSVRILRTSLMDAKVAKPIFTLLKHPNIKVQLAATAATTNLVLNFSPMREELVALGVVNVLCDHARSANPKLRFNCLWALKHLVVSADYKLKCQCLEALGTGWLVQILSTEPRETSGAYRAHMATANAAGEQVDLLNAMDEPSMDVDSDLEGFTDEDEQMGEDQLTRAPSSDEMRRTLGQTLRMIKETEENPVLQARNDDIRIQEQALDFIRNLIGEPGPGQHDMIEYLLLGFGANRLFELLTAKLKARPTTNTQSSFAPSQPPRGPAGKQPKLSISSSTGGPPSLRPTYSSLRPSSSESSRELWLNTPTDLIISTIFILIHIANGRPSHRHLLISQSPLMDALIPCFNHPDRRVRVACCWLVHNLTWQEDAADAGGAKTRAAMLRDRGVEAVVRGLVNDEDLDTRERAKGVSDVIRRLLDGGDGPMTGGFVGAGLGSSESRVWSR